MENRRSSPTTAWPSAGQSPLRQSPLDVHSFDKKCHKLAYQSSPTNDIDPALQVILAQLYNHCIESRQRSHMVIPDRLPSQALADVDVIVDQPSNVLMKLAAKWKSWVKDDKTRPGPRHRRTVSIESTSLTGSPTIQKLGDEDPVLSAFRVAELTAEASEVHEMSGIKDPIEMPAWSERASMLHEMDTSTPGPPPYTALGFPELRKENNKKHKIAHAYSSSIAGSEEPEMAAEFLKVMRLIRAKSKQVLEKSVRPEAEADTLDRVVEEGAGGQDTAFPMALNLEDDARRDVPPHQTEIAGEHRLYHAFPAKADDKHSSLLAAPIDVDQQHRFVPPKALPKVSITDTILPIDIENSNPVCPDLAVPPVVPSIQQLLAADIVEPATHGDQNTSSGVEPDTETKTTVRDENVCTQHLTQTLKHVHSNLTLAHARQTHDGTHHQKALEPVPSYKFGIELLPVAPPLRRTRSFQEIRPPSAIDLSVSTEHPLVRKSSTFGQSLLSPSEKSSEGMTSDRLAAIENSPYAKIIPHPDISTTMASTSPLSPSSQARRAITVIPRGTMHGHGHALRNYYGLATRSFLNAVKDGLHLLQETASSSHDIPPGLVRVRWTCSCGEELYDDYEELHEGAAKELEAALNGARDASTYLTVPSSAHGLSPSSAATPGSNSIFSVGSPVPSSATTCTTNVSTYSSPLSTKPTTGILASPATITIPARNPPWLLTCTEEGDFSTRLTHLDMGTDRIFNDKDLALCLRKHYKRSSSKWAIVAWFRLRGLTAIDFVHFELWPNRSVDIRACPSVPPPQQSDYDFIRNGLNPPIGRQYLVHLMRHPADYDNQQVAYHRIPKKMSRLEPGEYGWGIAMVETFLAERVWLLAIIVFGLGSAIFAITWGTMRRDIQGAFGVASWMVACAMLSIGWFQAKIG